MSTSSGIVWPRRVPTAVNVAASTIAFTVAVVAGSLAGEGWLYVLRGAGWLHSGPSVADSLPLLALAGADGQPLFRVAIAWVLAGALTGVALLRLPPPHRAALAGALCLVLLLFASQASYALVRNLALSSVITSRAPGAGPWLEALGFAVGCALPGRAIAGMQWVRRVQRPRTLALGGELGVRGGEDRDAAEHHDDRR
jgi:hypothetical protein